MYWVLALVVVLSSMCFGQVEGPWVVLEADEGRSLVRPRLADIAESIFRLTITDDIWGQSRLKTGVYDLTTEHWIIGPEIVREDSLSHFVRSLAAEGTAEWAVGFTLSGTYGTTARALGMSGGTSFDEYLASARWSSYPGLPSSYVSDLDIYRRVGGGWLATSVVLTSAGPYQETSTRALVAAFDVSGLDYQLIATPDAFSLSGPSSVGTVSVSHDTSWVYQTYYQDSFESGLAMTRIYPEMDTTVLDTICLYDVFCPYTAVDFRRVAEDRLYVFSDACELFALDTLGGCTSLTEQFGLYYPYRTGFNERFGFVALWLDANRIVLARMGLDGTVFEPETFYWRDTLHTIRDADVAVTDSGRVVVIWTEGLANHSPATRMLVARMEWDTPLGVHDRGAHRVPNSFSLSAYPNPFNSELRIRYAVELAQSISLSVYDLNGRIVATLVDAHVTAGMQEVSWNAHDVASGVYFVRLASEAGRVTEKVLLMK